MIFTVADHFYTTEIIRNFAAVVFQQTIISMPREIEMHICLGSSCFPRGNKDVVMLIKEYLKKHHLEDKVIFKGSRCMGNCSKGPNIMIDGRLTEGVTLALTEGILEKELVKLK